MIIESFNDCEMRNDDKTNYIRYRIGRLKHQLWLENRKNPDTFIIDEYDHFIVRNLRPGKTGFFGSAGYYLEDVIDDLVVIEEWPIVKKFYPKAHIIKHRSEIESLGFKFDNFVVNNNRSDIWGTLDTLTGHVINYTKAMNPGCTFFYSFRDTWSVDWNRLKVNHRDYFYDWGVSLSKIGLNMIWHDIQFAKKEKDGAGNYDGMENPDTTNGNIKFVFQYQSATHVIEP